MRIDFTPSLALYIWQSFRKSLWETVQQPAHAEAIWMLAADICSTQGCIAASIADSSAFLPALLALEPLYLVPDYRLLYDAHSGDPSNHVLPQQVEPVVRTLLLFAQLLLAVAAERKTLFSGSTDPMESSDETRLRSLIASKLHQLTDLSSCAPVLLSDPPTQVQTGAPQPLPTSSKRVRMLRSAVLIFKLTTLTFNVKADLVGHLDPDMPVPVQSLWHVMSVLAANILPDIKQLSGASTCPERADQEEEALRVLLCEHSVATLRQAHKEPEAGMQKQVCLRVLWVMLDGLHPELVRREVKRLGKASDDLSLNLLVCPDASLFCTQRPWFL